MYIYDTDGKRYAEHLRTLCDCWYDKEIKGLNKIKTSKAQLP